ncbi:sigma-70 family RNA polymerase sigma factor [Actinomycetospora sp. C-140]
MTVDDSGRPDDPDGSSDGDPRSDAELIARLRGRGADRDSTSAFATLYTRHEQSARALARQLARSPADADDLVAGAFTRLLEVLRAGRGPTEAFRAYLLTSVRHLAYDRSRAERRLDLTDDVTAVHAADPDDTIVPFTDPALAGLERTLAARAFATLPERWQAVLWHLEVEGDTPADIAPLFGLSANAVSALGYRAREGLRQAYLQEHLASSSGHWDRRHRDTGEKLGAYTRGGLARREAERVETHLAECAECRALAEELRDVNSGMLRAVVAPLVLGAGIVGYLASRGTTGPLAFDADSSQLAVAGGGALGVLGALSGISGLGGVSARPAASTRATRRRAAGVLGLAGAVGVAAFVVGDHAEPPPPPPRAAPVLPLVPGPSPTPPVPDPAPDAALALPGLLDGTEGAGARDRDPGDRASRGAGDDTRGVSAVRPRWRSASGSPHARSRDTPRGVGDGTGDRTTPAAGARDGTAPGSTAGSVPVAAMRAASADAGPARPAVALLAPADAPGTGDCVVTTRLPALGAAGVVCPIDASGR